MPIYEFDCSDCGEGFEALTVGFNTDEVTCPVCKSNNAKKKISTFAVKGSSAGSSSFSAAACSTGST